MLKGEGRGGEGRRREGRGGEGRGGNGRRSGLPPPLHIISGYATVRA